MLMKKTLPHPPTHEHTHTQEPSVITMQKESHGILVVSSLRLISSCNISVFEQFMNEARFLLWQKYNGFFFSLLEDKTIFYVKFLSWF